MKVNAPIVVDDYCEKKVKDSFLIYSYPLHRFAKWTLDLLESRTVWSLIQRSVLEGFPIKALVVATLVEHWWRRTTMPRVGRPSASSATSPATFLSGLNVDRINSPCSQKSASEYKILRKRPFSRKKEETHCEGKKCSICLRFLFYIIQLFFLFFQIPWMDSKAVQPGPSSLIERLV